MTHVPDPDLQSLQETVEVGLARSQEGLSGFLGTSVQLEGGRSKLVRVLEVPSLLDDPDQVVLGIYVGFHGDMSGHGLLLFDEASARWMGDLLLGNPPDTAALGDPLMMSALLELGNVTVGSFLNGVADRFGSTIHPFVPCVSHDMVGAILAYIAAALSVDMDLAVVIQTRFTFPDNADVTGYLLLLPDKESLQLLLNAPVTR